MALMVYGLPREVQELVCLIYGESEHAECVRCQYIRDRSRAGRAFQELDVGSLMG